jgi:hypothetical protein
VLSLADWFWERFSGGRGRRLGLSRGATSLNGTAGEDDGAIRSVEWARRICRSGSGRRLAFLWGAIEAPVDVDVPV